MVLAGSPRDEHAVLGPELGDEELEDETLCIAEDVLICGRSSVGFVRRLSRHLFINAGSVARSAVMGRRGERTAHAVLVQPYEDGVVRAFSADIELGQPRRVGSSHAAHGNPRARVG
jgi:hypothetical protein